MNLYNYNKNNISLSAGLNMESLPNEILFKIIMDLPIYDILKLCSSSKRLNEICYSNVFWSEKTYQDFGFPH